MQTLRALLRSLTLSSILFQLLISISWGQQIPFNSPIPTVTGISIRDSATADIDGDGILDFIAVNGQGVISINYGFGNGAHGNRLLIDPGAGIDGLVRSLDVGDLDGDLDVDIAMAWATPSDPGGFISVYINNGGVLGSRFDIPLDTQLNRTPFDLQLCDVNGDGRDDLVCCSNILNLIVQPASLTVIRSLGSVSGGGVLFSAPAHTEMSSLATDVLAHDLDGDGDLDAVMACRDGNMFVCFENDGTGSFTVASSIFFPLLPHPYSMVAADFNGDGFQDVVLGTWMTKSLILLEGDGTLGFLEGDEIPLGVFGWGLMQRIAAEDLDGDGFLDIIAPFSGGVVATRFNEGDARFLDEALFSSYQGPLAVHFSDLDLDGVVDLWMDHSNLEVMTAFCGPQNFTGYFHFEPQRVAAGLPASIRLQAAANRAIEAFEVAIDLDRSLLLPSGLTPSAEVMAATGPNGPSVWVVDLGSAPGDRVTLNCDLGLAPGFGLAAGVVLDCANLQVEVAMTSVPQQTILAPIGINGTTTAQMQLSGGVLVAAFLSAALIDIEIPVPFLRGDANDNGIINIADAVVILRRMFGIDPPGTCLAAEDADGDGGTDIGDAVRVVTYLFSLGEAPVAPFPTCDLAPDPLILPCTERVSCP
ncbi:MAG: VCBS repeat-containing protein [Planctomycetota bacterium]|nr:VCBS repeat-containing protein [Planctomycetota bacterium]